MTIYIPSVYMPCVFSGLLMFLNINIPATFPFNSIFTNCYFVLARVGRTSPVYPYPEYEVF